MSQRQQGLRGPAETSDAERSTCSASDTAASGSAASFRPASNVRLNDRRLGTNAGQLCASARYASSR